MSSKSLLKFMAVMMTALVAAGLLSGCGNKKYVYNTSSEFIEVSHPDKPNVNKFSQDEDDFSSDDEKNTGNTAVNDSNSAKSSDESKSQSQDDKSNGGTVSSQSQSSGSASDEFGGDQSPIVVFE